MIFVVARRDATLSTLPIEAGTLVRSVSVWIGFDASIASWLIYGDQP